MMETNITKMFGIKHPIVGAPMGPFPTTVLAAGISEAGGLGILSHTTLFEETGAFKDSATIMKENILYVTEHTDKPFGFNIRTSRLQIDADNMITEVSKFIRENTRIKEQCIYALSSAGSAKRMPQNKEFQKLKESGSQIKHFHVAPAMWLADKCVKSGVDGMVLTGYEGGGHQSYEKVSTLVLLQQAQQKFPDIPKIACGGFATGAGLAAALSLGAGAIAMGSRFIASKDSDFHDNYKNIIPSAKAQDTVMTTGILGAIRLWKNNYSLPKGLVSDKKEKLEEEKDFTKMSQEEFIAAMAKRSEAGQLTFNGKVNDGSVLIGQSIGIINSVETVDDIIGTIVKDAKKALKNGYNLIK
ncbi:MAG: NAD(P)H-dependent flavin oxidoreductase [Promethearchaeota archaeon]